MVTTRLVRALAGRQAAHPLTLRNALSGSRPKRDEAVDWLVTNGCVGRAKQATGNAILHTSIRPFRERVKTP